MTTRNENSEENPISMKKKEIFQTRCEYSLSLPSAYGIYGIYHIYMLLRMLLFV